MPSNELEQLVVANVAKSLTEMLPSASDATAIEEEIKRNKTIADKLVSGSIAAKRKILLSLNVGVQIHSECVAIKLTPADNAAPIKININAKLAKSGCEIKLLIAHGDPNSRPLPNPMLQKMIAQAFAAQAYLLGKDKSPMIATYSDLYLNQLARISWLAPDIIASIMDGTQPVDLTGRKLTRANRIPLDWPAQRKMFGFA